MMTDSITNKEIKFLNKIIHRNSKSISKKYKLSPNSLSNEDIIKGFEVLSTKKITMGKKTKLFEKEFSKFIGSKYALMVNSGSSANLLATFALTNPLHKNKLKKGDECLIPALCWSTSLWPIVQSGLVPKFVDVDPETLNISLTDLEKQITKKTKALMLVHVLGNSANMNKLIKIVKKHQLKLIEDTCESLGSKYRKKSLGTFGNFGTYSFYYSHQITSGEGGMIVCNTKNDFEIIHSLRSHGWDRGLKGTKDSFNFINSGFNLRPTEISAAIGLNQFKRIKTFQKIREHNRQKIITKLKSSNNWNNQFDFIYPINSLKPSWFGMPMLINKKFLHKKNKFLKYLTNCGIENRPIISGNFLNQPSIKLYNLRNKKKFFGAQEIEDRGFFIGIHINKINNKTLNFLEKKLLSINSF